MKPYKLIGEQYTFMKNKFEEMEKFGLITKGESDWAMAIMCVPKKSPTKRFRCL